MSDDCQCAETSVMVNLYAFAGIALLGASLIMLGGIAVEVGAQSQARTAYDLTIIGVSAGMLAALYPTIKYAISTLQKWMVAHD